MTAWPEGKIAPWEAGYNPSNFPPETAAALEESHAASPGSSPNPMGNEVVHGGAPYDSINWCGGSPTNYSYMMAETLELDKGGGTSGMISIYAPTQGEVQQIFGSDWESYQDQDSYLYTMREPSGKGVPAMPDAVLTQIGREYGQEGLND